jgi:hypothetical protein
VRETTGELAGELAQALGRRKGLGNQQLQWVRARVGEFFNRMTSAEAADALFRETFSRRFTVVNEGEMKQELISRIINATEITHPLRSVNEAIEHAVALFPARRLSAKKPQKIGPAPSPGKQVADPIGYPSMTVTDIRKLFHKSRSSCLILTSSVKPLLVESPE